MRMFRFVKNLRALLAGISPKKEPGEFYFVSIPHGRRSDAQSSKIIGSFKEKEGMTYIVEKGELGAFSKIQGARVSSPYSLITLDVYSDLASIGFIAAVSKALANRGVSVNVVSAYCHDHLLVPVKDTKRAMSILRRISKESAEKASRLES